ncbi:MAG: GTP-binding protein [Nanoarchaeota archaeon]|nr:GTP-binding protein [Nanoarchaeota archaeon]MEC8339546.1 GTP-binding protein [Nanoarchaeota archaeon]
MNDTRIPILIVTGFLGSGKTTFINNLLGSIENKKIAIIENEFAELGIDANLINKKEGSNVFELNNGCICCTMNGELEGVFGNLAKEKENWDYVILETTGVADPSPIINSIISNPLVEEFFRLDSMYTVVDSKHVLEQIRRDFEAKKQIVFANTILVNKVDLIEKQQLEKVRKRLISLNPEADIKETTFSNIEIENLFEKHDFEKFKIRDIEKSFQFFSFGTQSTTSPMITNKHLGDINSFGISFKEEISLPKFDFFIRSLVQARGEDLYRIKGIVNIKDSNQPIIFQGVHETIDWIPGPPWEDDQLRETKIVFIGKNLEKEFIENYIKDLINVEE